MEVNKLGILDLPIIKDQRGNLSFFESNQQVPFEIKRVYWIYDVPGGELRGSHAFKDADEFIVALSGSFDVVVHDGTGEKVFRLNRSYHGLLIPKLNFRRIENFSTNSLGLICSSTVYSENDYIRDFVDFLNVKKS